MIFNAVCLFCGVWLACVMRDMRRGEDIGPTIIAAGAYAGAVVGIVFALKGIFGL